MPISSMLVAPTRSAPAFLSLPTAVESIGATKPLRIFEAAVVGRPSKRILSLVAIGIPSRGDSC